MKKEKLVSIIIPVYNTELYISQCIDSLLAQTYKNIEIVAVNDGSKDSSPTILQNYANKFPNIKYISKENGGVSSARNTALKNTSGEYITFIDADDWVDANHIENLVTTLEDNSADLSICLNKWEKRSDKPFINKNSSVQILSQMDALKNMFVGKLFPGGYCTNKLFKKDLIGNLEFDSNIFYTEDLLFVYLYLKKCKKIAFSNMKTYHYIKTEGSIVRSKFSAKKLTALTNLKNISIDTKSWAPELYDFAYGLYCQLNFEIFFYLIRDKVKDKALKQEIHKNFKDSVKSLTSTKQFQRYRRILIPFGFKLLRLCR